MLKPHEMQKILIAGSKTHLERTIELLHESNILHLEEFREEDPELEDFKIGSPLPLASPASEKIVKLRAAGKILDIEIDKDSPPRPKEVRVPPTEIVNNLDKVVFTVEQNIMSMGESRSKIDRELNEINRQINELEPFQNLPMNLEDYGGYENIGVVVGVVRGSVENRISKITNRYELFEDPTGSEGTVIALFIDRKSLDEATRALLEMGYKELRVPEGKGSVAENLYRLKQNKDKMQQKLEHLDEELNNLRKKLADKILASQEILEIEIEKAEAPLRFATTKYSFVIKGYIPRVKAEGLRAHLHEGLGGRLFIELMEPSEDDAIPVQMDNPKIARPFEILTDLVDRPKYKEIDPTVVMWIGMPLFFGFMLGDIGYALFIIILIYSGVFNKIWNFLGMKTTAKMLNKILIFCALWSLLFGFLYNEIFGVALLNTPHLEHLHSPVVLKDVYYPEFTTPWILWFSPTHFPVHRFDKVLPLLKLVVWMGAIHLFIGLLIGFRNEYVKKGFKHALGEKGSWLFIIAGGALLLYFGLSMITDYAIPSWASSINIGGMEILVPMLLGFILLILGCGLLIMGEGIIGLTHLPSILSNTMSYARLLAIGLSSAGIALAFNNMAFDIAESGGAYLIAACLVLFAGHFINFLLGIIGPGLHGLRLHYVEFFIKFYEGGGVRYTPFGYLRRYTAKG
jgi:V/A-type H+-transporting ATPase subunit I